MVVEEWSRRRHNQFMEDPLTSDEQLVAVLMGRDQSASALRAAQEACQQLYQRHASKLLAFLAARVPRSSLEDLHQEIWRKVWQYASAAFKGGNFRAWLHTLARNCMIDLGRKRSIDSLSDAAALADERRPKAQDILLEAELHGILKKCLEKMSSDGAALVQARLAGESYQDICQRTGMKPEKAHKLFHETKTLLQNCVERGLA
jgi:RNA polymerase sigma factor (sigma-70 family)